MRHCRPMLIGGRCPRKGHTMSNTNYCTTTDLLFRGSRSGVVGLATMPAGVKKAAKRRISRTARHAGGLELKKFDLWPANLADLTAAELEVLATELLLDDTNTWDPGMVDANDYYGDPYWEQEIDQEREAIALANADADYVRLTPLPEFGGLPDYLASRIEEAKGDAFELLSLFEARPAKHLDPAKQFAATRQDARFDEMLIED